jgi:hypothetical protein
MTADEYRKALSRLGLSQVGAASVLGVSPRTAQTYAAEGPSGPAALAIKLLLALPKEKRAKFLA